MGAMQKTGLAVAALVLAAGCASRYPDERALDEAALERMAIAQGPLRLGQTTTWAPQYVIFSGEGRFDGIGPSMGAAIRTNPAYAALPAVAFIVPVLFVVLIPGEALHWPDGEEARWLAGGGLIVGALVDAICASSGAPGGSPYLGIPFGRARLFPEIGLEYSRHELTGDELHSLRWSAGLRMEPRMRLSSTALYGRVGAMFAEMHLEAGGDFIAPGPYAGLGLEWSRWRSGRRVEEPTELGAFVEGGAAFLGEEGDDGVLTTVSAGLSCRW
jgi:hypothetical protein